MPEVLAHPVAEGPPQRTVFAAGDTLSRMGAYFLNVETGIGEAWIYPGAESGWWLSPDGQQLALLVQGQTPSILLLDLSSGTQKVLAVPGSGSWIGSAGLLQRTATLKCPFWSAAATVPPICPGGTN